MSLTFAYYELDPIGFIENLCENIDKPELQCNGKCQLMKAAKSSSSENKNAPNIINFKDILLYKENIITYVFTKDLVVVFQNYNYQNFYSYQNLSDCFHPPQIVFS
ncbi:hypothetical protein [Pontimicrobium aquaticum]|uniref:Uncharacterized protein n=1 Tax=Pontimicrobium aquaticum TaxID=2565367 RepID=A0A4U0EVQ2_9FLAO|nr:hypothetical protein [Pontimicrobium aquaticum]TJY35910.1 hypothetical protein E5167_08570 [Pontimicrobium aquaticum]